MLNRLVSLLAFAALFGACGSSHSSTDASRSSDAVSTDASGDGGTCVDDGTCAIAVELSGGALIVDGDNANVAQGGGCTYTTKYMNGWSFFVDDLPPHDVSFRFTLASANQMTLPTVGDYTAQVTVEALGGTAWTSSSCTVSVTASVCVKGSPDKRALSGTITCPQPAVFDATASAPDAGQLGPVTISGASFTAVVGASP